MSPSVAKIGSSMSAPTRDAVTLTLPIKRSGQLRHGYGSETITMITSGERDVRGTLQEIGSACAGGTESLNELSLVVMI